MTLISHEIPKTLFQSHNLINDYPFALGHLLNKDKEYSDFYRCQFKDSSFGILDNSCFELGKSINSKELFNLVAEYKPSHYVLPDKLHDKKETLDMCSDFIGNLFQKALSAKPIGVVQGITFSELVECINWYVDHKVSCIAIPFDPLPDSDFGITRYLFFQEIFSLIKDGRGRLIEWHFLGCQNPSELLLYSEEELSHISSIDTSSPIITGWKGIKYGEYGYSQSKPKEKLAENLGIELTNDQIQDIIYNVKKFKQYLQR